VAEAAKRSRTGAGWAELEAGRWEAARASFEQALAGDDAPEALEGLSWAAWWLDDGPAVFDARERAYALYRREGAATDAARMATWIAVDQIDFNGASAVAEGWLRRAHRLLDPLSPGPDHGWLAFHEGFLANLRGDTAGACVRATFAAGLGRRFGVPDLEMLGLALEGAALVASAQVDAGMRCLDEATATALEGEASIPISSAWTFCFLVTACTAVHDFDRAAEWCDRIAEFADRYGSRYMLAFCRAEYGAVHLWRGRWSDAEAMLQASVEDFSRSRPAWSGGPLVGLAELRRRQGRAVEAGTLLDDAGNSGGALVVRAQLALDRGDSRSAADLAERALRRVSPERVASRFPALAVLVRARIARGELEEAVAPLAAFRDAADRVGTSPLRAMAELVEGMLAAAAGDHERARPLLEDAVDRFERSGAPFETAQARIELATSLIALGRTGDAAHEARRALEGLLEVGAALEVPRARRLLDDPARGDDVGRKGLSRRETEVLELLVDGLTNRQIAERLVVSEHTVHRHVTHILRKLEVPSRTAAAAQAVRAGILGKPPA